MYVQYVCMYVTMYVCSIIRHLEKMKYVQGIQTNNLL